MLDACVEPTLEGLRRRLLVKDSSPSHIYSCENAWNALATMKPCKHTRAMTEIVNVRQKPDTSASREINAPTGCKEKVTATCEVHVQCDGDRKERGRAGDRGEAPVPEESAQRILR
jgi:hypothetical protein